MAALERTFSAIGPVTEARIQAAFAQAAVIGGTAAGDIIGCDLKTLNALADAGAIRAVRKGGGKTRGYTEGDIRWYLEQSSGPCRDHEPKPRASGPQSGAKVVPFSQRKTSVRR